MTLRIAAMTLRKPGSEIQNIRDFALGVVQEGNLVITE